MKPPTVKTIVTASVLVGIVVLLGFLHPTHDADRYADFLDAYDGLSRAQQGASLGSERIAAAIHLATTLKHYQRRFDSSMQALLASGYFVQLTIPIRDLHGHRGQVCDAINRTHGPSGDYIMPEFDFPNNELRLLCRRDSLSLWRTAFKDIQ